MNAKIIILFISDGEDNAGNFKGRWKTLIGHQ